MRDTLITILEHHHGKENAITARELARKLWLHTDRGVRLVIRQLITDGYPIAASVSVPKGYYIIRMSAERDEYLQVLRSRLIEDAKRRRDFKKSAGQ